MDIFNGVCECDTTIGIQLRDFNARLEDSITIWEVQLTKGTKYKFIVFDRNCYKKKIKPQKSVSTFLSIYYGNDNKKITNEDYINSTSKTDELANCFVLDCNKSGSYFVTIEPIEGKIKEKNTCAIGIIYYLGKLNKQRSY